MQRNLLHGKLLAPASISVAAILIGAIHLFQPELPNHLGSVLGALAPISLKPSESVLVNCPTKQLMFTRLANNKIRLECQTAPTITPAIKPQTSLTPTAMMHGTPMPSSSTTAPGTTSMAMGAWAKQKQNLPGECSTVIHDSYSVIGPDGKRYPTWHPPVDPKTGCSFGHEHGRDPSGYAYWADIKKHFAYDGDKNGTISDAELATAGIPFGYVNEQMDVHSAHTGAATMRHEDHVGHKIDYANGEGDIGDGTDPFDSSKTGGVVVPEKTASGNPKWNQSGIRCYHFHKIHQGVSSPDALGNNLHENIMHETCTSSRSEFPASSSILAAMVPFGAPGEFIKFCNNDRTTPIVIGKTTTNSSYPGTRQDGMRNIMTRDCVEQSVLVPNGQFSSFPYEIWDGSIRIRTAGGTQIAKNGGSWEVLDAIRYYNPASGNSISYAADLCYETMGDRSARGGACGLMRDTYGATNRIAWNDPRSEFRGIHRGQYVLPHQLSNANGPTYWYADPFGGNASTTPFAGSIRQFISPVSTRISFNSDPRIILRYHADGNNTVHAPN